VQNHALSTRERAEQYSTEQYRTEQYRTVQYRTVVKQVLRAWFSLKVVKPVRNVSYFIEKPVRNVSYYFL